MTLVSKNCFRPESAPLKTEKCWPSVQIGCLNICYEWRTENEGCSPKLSKTQRGNWHAISAKFLAKYNPFFSYSSVYFDPLFAWYCAQVYHELLTEKKGICPKLLKYYKSTYIHLTFTLYISFHDKPV